MKFTKTDVGQAAFKERSPLFSARQRSAFILFDGQKTADQVLQATAGMGLVAGDIDYMVAQGFLAPTQATPATALPVVASAPLIEQAEDAALAVVPVSNRTPQERYSDAKPIATKPALQAMTRPDTAQPAAAKPWNQPQPNPKSSIGTN